MSCRRTAAPLCAVVALTLAVAACVETPRRNVPPAAPGIPSATQLPEVPPSPESVPDVVPRAEPRSPYGNPPFYDVFGKRYYVLSSSVGYVERGVASWYGPGFHKVRTSTGEPYDMYAMSAAHKTLPLPCYVHVTNLQNGRSIVVRVNDRGPFVGNRIIDLSYTAAAKLDMLRNGTAIVEVSSIDFPPPSTTPVTMAAAPPGAAHSPTATPIAGAPGPTATPIAGAPGPTATPTGGALAPATAASTDAPAPAAGPIAGASAPGAAPVAGVPAVAAPAPRAIAPVPVTGPVVKLFFIQAGAFADPNNAQRLAARLRGGGYGTVFVRDNEIAGRRIYRVRIGPISSVEEFDRIVAGLGKDGIPDARLALD